MEELIFLAFAAPQLPIQPGSCTYRFRFFSLSKVETAWTEVFGPK